MIACREVRRIAGRYLALDLDRDTEAAVRSHLHECQACRAAYLEREPALAFAWSLAAVDGPADESFVGEVLAGMRQRQVERRLSGHRRWLAAAAAVVVMLLGGTVTVRLVTRAPNPTVAQRAASIRALGEPAVVELSGAETRLYRFTVASSSETPVQVAVVVDPRLEF
jgi:predicted anti-sigma-YlaC factor YlaD